MPTASSTDIPGSGGRSIGRAFTQQLTGRLGATGISFLVVALSSRYFGPESFGQLSAALAFIGLFAAFADFGINAVVTRRAAQTDTPVGELIGTSVGLTLAYALPVSLLVAAVSLAVYGTGAGAISWFVIGLIPYLLVHSVTSSYIPAFQVSHNFTAYGAAEFLSAVATLAGMAAISALDGSIWSYVLVVNLAAVVRYAIIRAGARVVGPIRIRLVPREWTGLLREAWAIGLASLIGVIYYRVDTILLSVLSTDTQVGLYGLAYRIVGVVATIPALLVTSSFFAVSKATEDAEEFRAQSGTLLARTVGISTLLVLGGLLLTDGIVVLVGGEAFAGAVPVLGLMLVATALLSVNTALGAVLTAAHRQRVVLVIGGVSLLVNVVALLALVPDHGAVGAAWSLVASEVFSVLCMLVVAVRFLDWKGMVLGSAPALAAAAAMVGADFLVGDLHVLLAGSVLLAAYAAAYAVFDRWAMPTLRSLRGKVATP